MQHFPLKMLHLVFERAWENNADPYNVMWAQSTQADDSQIWMTFENATQYPAEGKQSFRVFFK